MDQVNTHATFAKDDKFERVRYAEMCMKLIASHPADRGACTIAVDAPWGVGKSTFLWMWINALKENNAALLDEATEQPANSRKLILPIYYNAWENDFCDSALAPLLFSFCAMVDRKQDEKHSCLKEDVIKKVISTSLGLLAAVGVKLKTKDDILAQAAGHVAEVTTSGIISALSKRAHAADDTPEKNSIGYVYDQQLQAREDFRKALMELVQQFGGVYIFIDELDRCKPSFAIDTLDAIKHYFDIPGLTFIFGVDMLQLGHAISGRYGYNYDAEGYLSKFFEHHIMLPTPTAEQMIKFCQPTASLYPDTYRRLTDIFQACMVSPREIPRIMKACNTLNSILWPQCASQARETAREFSYLLASMRFRLTRVYNAYIAGSSDWNVHHWDETYSFGGTLLFFAPYMKMPVSDCLEKWNDIIQNKSTATSNDEEAKNCACIGRVIFYNSNYRNSDTFGQCLSRFMEQVHI